MMCSGGAMLAERKIYLHNPKPKITALRTATFGIKSCISREKGEPFFLDCNFAANHRTVAIHARQFGHCAFGFERENKRKVIAHGGRNDFEIETEALSNQTISKPKSAVASHFIWNRSLPVWHHSTKTLYKLSLQLDIKKRTAENQNECLSVLRRHVAFVQHRHFVAATTSGEECPGYVVGVNLDERSDPGVMERVDMWHWVVCDLNLCFLFAIF